MAARQYDAVVTVPLDGCKLLLYVTPLPPFAPPPFLGDWLVMQAVLAKQNRVFVKDWHLYDLLAVSGEPVCMYAPSGSCY
jgi:hypothetical protein